MISKKCKMCEINKDITEFGKNKRSKDGLENRCKKCNRLHVGEYQKKYRDSHKSEIIEYRKVYAKKNKNKILEKQCKIRETSEYKDGMDEWRKKNKEHIKNYSRIYYLKNREKILENRKKSDYYNEYRLKNKDIIKAKAKEYNQKESTKLKKREYKKNRFKNDIWYKISNYTRSRVNKVLKGNLKSGKTFELIGCTVNELKLYLESKFVEGMTWENYGLYGWHIDHIRPCASFDLSDPEQQKICFHYTNLQPLWAEDNLTKGDKC